MSPNWSLPAEQTCWQDESRRAGSNPVHGPVPVSLLPCVRSHPPPCMRVLLMLAVAMCLRHAPAAADSLIFESRSDWESWSFPQGTVKVSQDGRISPRYYRKNINACLNASDFVWVDKNKNEQTGGVRNAGSNAGTAQRMIDGDMTTSWGPRRTDDPRNWFVEIDLGRLVTATKLILRFDQEADPFEEFSVYTSDGTPAFVSAAVEDAPDYRTVARVIKPNREMVLEYPLRDTQNSDIHHRSVRYVYVELTAWRDPQTRPRLAELEVIALGDNVVLGSRERGGGVTAYSAGGVAGVLIDGDGVSFWDSSRRGTFPEAHWYFHVNLGARFWVDTILLVAYPPGILGDDVTPPVHHTIEVSDGTPQPGAAEAWEAKGPYLWTQVEHVTQNPPPGADRPLYVLDTHFEPRQVARIFYDHLTPPNTNAGQIRIREVQAFGEGYIPGATMQSDFIDLGRPSSMTSVFWGAETPPNTDVEIRTRTGDEIIEEVRYYTTDGAPVRDKNNNGTSQDEYEKLPPFLKGAIEELVKPGAGWSGWSRAYLNPGDRFLSPSPRRYLQIEATLRTTEPDAAPSLDRIELSYSDPLAASVVGEITPSAVEAPGVYERFTYYIRPTFERQSVGFDEILITTPSRAELREVRVGGQVVQTDSVRATADSLWLRLPLVRHQADPLVQVGFDCTVYLNGTPFDAFLRLSSQPQSIQSVPAGDATEAVDSEKTVVATPVEAKLLDWVAEPPAVFTPNGDGVNDELVFEFVVFKINAPRPIGVRIFALDGSLVREIQQTGTSREYKIGWDGRDEGGEMVVPGVYLAQVFAEGTDETSELNQFIAVAY